MEVVELSSWSDFPSAIENIKSQYGHHELAGTEIENIILYRGQPSAEWRLESTLERFSDKMWSVEKYAYLANECGPEVESFTDRSWDFLSRDDLKAELDAYDPIHKDLPDYSFWIYLRQHGFPSPLLDWTRSPYIGAFFAAVEREEADKVAVFTYVETPEGGKGGIVGAKAISVQGPYVRAHRRHFLQQCWYTICTEHGKNGYQFTSHEDVFARERRLLNEDVLVKITIPRTERLKMLRDLQSMNITQFSLFQTEEALIRTLAFDRIEQYEL